LVKKLQKSSSRIMKPKRKRIGEIPIALVDETLVALAEEWLSACERCAENAVVSLDYVLDALTGSDPNTEYVMRRPARCPLCLGEITEKTMVALKR
jgi:hypothetical protein